MGYIEELRALVGPRPLILVGAAVLIVDVADRLLMLHRTDNDAWGIPGGYAEVGESLEDCARREAYEETGLRVGRLRLFGAFSGPEFFYRYPNGDQVHNVSIVYVTREFRGDLRVDKEGRDLRFFDLRALPQKVNPPDRQVLRAYAEQLAS